MCSAQRDAGAFTAQIAGVKSHGESMALPPKSLLVQSAVQVVGGSEASGHHGLESGLSHAGTDQVSLCRYGLARELNGIRISKDIDGQRHDRADQNDQPDDDRGFGPAPPRDCLLNTSSLFLDRYS